MKLSRCDGSSRALIAASCDWAKVQARSGCSAATMRITTGDRVTGTSPERARDSAWPASLGSRTWARASRNWRFSCGSRASRARRRRVSKVAASACRPTTPSTAWRMSGPSEEGSFRKRPNRARASAVVAGSSNSPSAPISAARSTARVSADREDACQPARASTGVSRLRAQARNAAWPGRPS